MHVCYPCSNGVGRLVSEICGFGKIGMYNGMDARHKNDQN